MDTSSDKSKTLLQLSAPISSKVQLGEIRLVRSVIESPLGNLDAGPVRFSISSRTQHDPETKKILVIAEFEVCTNTEDETAKLFRIAAMFSASYDIESLEGLEQENVDAFGRMNGIYNIWPYWREYVQATTTRLGLPPLTLPVLTGERLQAIYLLEDKRVASTMPPASNVLTVASEQEPAKPNESPARKSRPRKRLPRKTASEG